MEKKGVKNLRKTLNYIYEHKVKIFCILLHPLFLAWTLIIYTNILHLVYAKTYSTTAFKLLMSVIYFLEATVRHNFIYWLLIVSFLLSTAFCVWMYFYYKKEKEKVKENKSRF